MRYLLLSILAAISSVCALSAEAPAAVKTGRLSVVQLLKVVRAEPTGSKEPADKAPVAPDGLVFHFMITRTPAGTGTFTIKETRDFRIGGESYQKKTRQELAKNFEPGTMINGADRFFLEHPELSQLAPKNGKGVMTASVRITGSKLTAGGAGEVTLHFGYEKVLEDFTFAFVVP